MSPLSTDMEQTRYFCPEKTATPLTINTFQTPLGVLYMLVTPVVKFVFGQQAAGSATCKEKLLSFFFKAEKTSPALSIC